MNRYTSIRSALRFIPRNLYDRSTDLDFLTWMLDAFRQLDLPVTYDSKINIFEIDNHRIVLPEDIREIKSVYWLKSNPSQKDIDDLLVSSVKTIDTTTTVQTNVKSTVIPKNVFTGSSTNNLGTSTIPGATTPCSKVTFDCNVTGVTKKPTSIKLNINKQIINSLDIFLVSPNGECIAISKFALSGSSNFTDTIFKDGFPLPFNTATGPYTGTFGPVGAATSSCSAMPIATLNTFSQFTLGQNGIWKLHVTDKFNGDIGTMIGWELTFDVADPTTVNETTTVVTNTSETEPKLLPVYYRQFLDSNYFKNNYILLQYKGNGSNSLLCNNCPNKHAVCQHTFTVDKYNVLRTNLKDGFICIDYFTEMKDEHGDFLIPDLTELKQYLAYYAMAKHWEERAMVKEQSADRIAQDMFIKAEMFFKKIRGILIMRGINPNDITNMQFDGYNQWIKIPERYVFAR